MPDQLILRVAVPAPLHNSFDYLPPADTQVESLLPGMRVSVPFGRGDRCGVLLEILTEENPAGRRLKHAHAILDQTPLLMAADLEFLIWAGRYYQHPIGEVIANALPVRLRKGESPVSIKAKRWHLTDLGAQQEASCIKRAPKQAALFGLLKESAEGLAKEQLADLLGAY